MSSKKHRNGAIKQNKKTDQLSNGSLFSEVDAKSIDVSDYTIGHGAPQTNRTMYEQSIPTGVVDVDESVLSTLSSNSYQQYDRQQYTNTRSSHEHDREHVQLPPIIHQYPQHYPYEYIYRQPNYHHDEHLQYSHPVHHHRRHYRHHKHDETYDPRWWYMPINSVHGPRSQQFVYQHHYKPPKWYELPSRK